MKITHTPKNQNMKKNYKLKSRLAIALFAFTFLFAKLQAQVNAYSFAQSVGTYTEITGGTILITASSNAFGNAGFPDEQIYNVPLPFTFNFNSVAHTAINVSANGFITFGATAPTDINYTPISSVEAYSSAVSAWGADLSGMFNVGGRTSVIRYEAIGTAPNRTFVVQYKDYRPTYATSTATAPFVNFQIRLEESTNIVSVVYGASGYAAGTLNRTSSLQIGLRGSVNTDFNNRTNATTVLFTASAAGAANTVTQAYSSQTATPGRPSNGLTYVWTPPLVCSGTPSAGITNGPATICSGVNFTLGLTGATTGASGITYQWQSSPDGITYSNVAGTSATFTTSQTASTYYQCIVTCTGSASSATSTPLVVNMVPTTYATIPYLETFEASWINGCATKDIVSSSWKNNPVTGNNSWRRQDEGATAAWSYLPGGLVTPSGSTGAASFHTYGSLSSLIGTYDLYLDLSTTSAVSLGFNYQNATGTDILEVLLSTDGGVTFGPVLATYTTGSWAIQSLNLGVVGSATSVIRFKATSDYGNDDIGIDNVVVDLSPSCIAPNALTVIPTAASAATVSWTCLACTGSFIVEYGPAGFTPGATASPGAGGTIASLTATSPFNLTGLPTTGITDIYVRQDCGSSAYSSNASVAKFIPGDVCENAINLATLTSPYNGTTFEANDNFTNTCAGGNSSSDLIFTIDVPDLYTLVIGQSINGYDSENTLFYGGACPGTTQIACYDDPDIQSTIWQNTTGSTQTVYWVQDGYYNASNNGTFTLEWSLTAPASCVAPIDVTVVPTSPTDATVSWNCIACTGSFIVEYGSEGFTPGAASTPGVGGTIASLTATSPFNLTGLPSTSVTDVYVRQDCGSSDYSLNANVAKFIPGDVCENAIDLATLTSPFNGTTTGANDNFTNTCAGGNSSSDLVFTIDVPDLYTLVIGQTANGYDSENTLFYGGACPGTTQIACYDDPDIQSSTWQNTTGSTQTVYWVQDGFSNASNNGTFKLEWTLTPPNCPQPNGLNVTGVSTSGATLNWNCASCTGTYSIEYGPAGFAPGSGTTVTSSVASVVVTGLTNGTNYEFYVTQNCSSSSNGFSTAAGPYAFSTTIAGDAVCDAIALTIGTNGPYNNTAASAEIGEPIPPTGTAGCSTQTTWCGSSTTPDNSMWFTFVAPASGRVKIQSPGFDTQLALWSASNCSSILTGGATLIAANDDDADYLANGGAMFSSMLDPIICLTPGTTYYVQLDGYQGTVGSTTIILTDLGLVNSTFTGLSSSYCIGASSAALTPTTLGGVFSGTGISGSTFDPAIAGVGSYAVTYTLDGCYTSIQSVTVNTLPTVTATSTGSAVCTGTSVTLTGGGATSYAWDNSVVDGTAFVPTGSLIYNVVGTDANGCTNTASVSVTVNALPTVTATSIGSSVCSGTTVTLTGGGATTYAWDNSVVDGTAFVPTGTTTYNVVGTDVNGCTNTASVSVTVNTLPIIMASSTPVLCNGGTSSVTITGMDGTPSYTGEGTFTQSAGTTTYSITDANGCVASTSVTISEPALISSTQILTVCAGEVVLVGSNSYSTTGIYTDVLSSAIGCDSTVTTDLTVNAALDLTTSVSGNVITATSTTATYQWIDCDNGNAIIASETGQSYTALSSGNFAVIITEGGSCSDTSACVNVSVTGIDSNFEQIVSIYPNPSNGLLTFSINNVVTNQIVISILDIQGKIVFTETDKNIAAEYKKQINLSDLAKGIYYVKLNIGSEVKTQKLIIQ